MLFVTNNRLVTLEIDSIDQQKQNMKVFIVIKTHIISS